MAKKVIYGLKNLYYAVETDSGSALSYGTPVPWTGSVNWTCTPRVAEQNFEADDDEGYYRAAGLSGFDITVETAAIPESFLTDVLGATKDTTDGTITYNKGDTIKRVALMVRRTINVDGVETKKDLVIYHAKPNMPAAWDGSTSSGKEPKTVTINFRSDANPYTGDTHAETTDTPVSSVQSGWYTAVYQP